MKYRLLLSLSTLLFINTGVAYDDAYKLQFLQGYENRCKTVLSKKGYPASAVNRNCGCERTVVNRHFSIFDVMMVSLNKDRGRPAITPQAINRLKARLRQCRLKYLLRNL